MSINSYARDCTRNVMGCSELHVISAQDIASIDIAGSGSITGITLKGGATFAELEADIDGINRTEEGAGSEVRTHAPFKIIHRVEVYASKISLELQNLKRDLSSISAGGIVTVVKDNNGKYWLTGYSSERADFDTALRLFGDMTKTGFKLFEEEAGKAYITLQGANNSFDLQLAPNFVDEILADMYPDVITMGITLNAEEGKSVVSIGLTVTSGKYISLNWGGGEWEAATADGALHSYEHEYGIGEHRVRLSGDFDFIEKLTAIDSAVDYTNFNDELDIVEDVRITGGSMNVFPDIKNSTALTFIDISDNNYVAGMDSDCFTLLTSLLNLKINDSRLRNFNGTLLSTCALIGRLELTGNDIVASDINTILSIINGFGTSSGSINLSGGTNGAPFGAGSTAKTALEGRGWSVTTN